MRRLFERIFSLLGIGYGWCGGCDDPDCDDCRTEWPNEKDDHASDDWCDLGYWDGR